MTAAVRARTARRTRRLLEQRRRRSRATQAGYTLMELLLVIGIAGIIFVPLMAWAGLAIRQQPVVQDGMLRTASAGLLGSYLPKDVSVAGKAANAQVGFTQQWSQNDCVGGAGANGSVKLIMVTGGEQVQKIVYSQAPSSEDPAQRSIWRRVCNPGTGALISATEVYRDVNPSLTQVTCTSEPGDTPCRQVAVAITPRTTNQAVTVNATRRVDEAAVPTDVGGNPTPTPSIEVVSRSGTQPMVAQLSASGSTAAPGRSIAAFKWEIDGPAPETFVSGSASTPDITISLPIRGDYNVLLTVTDDRGITNTSYAQLKTSNAEPRAAASVNPLSGDIGTTFTLDGSMSDDPDGTLESIDWIVTYPDGTENRLSGAVVQITPPATAIGTSDVRLIVTDVQGAQGFLGSTFTVNDPAAPPPDPENPPPGPGDPGQLVASFTDAAAPGSAQSFDASGTTGIGTSTASYTWSFGDGGSGTGAAPTHQYPNDGVYTVALTVTTSDGRSASTSRAIAVGGAAPAPINVRHDGVSVLWNAVPGARRYLVDFDFRTATDCYLQISNQAVGAGPNPSKALPQNPCPSHATARARVGTDANGSVTWSEWIEVPALGTVVPPTTTPPEVVK